MTKLYPNLPDKKEFMNDQSITDSETCLITKSPKLSFGHKRSRAEKPLQIIHADTMGPISPVRITVDLNLWLCLLMISQEQR